ncbi:MAG: GDSL-type esterase/lipase family protein, partial [Bacteroidales bacterium]|nr:GDSL-type esterase/lipase family protein [Bacteroidales bacterium]
MKKFKFIVAASAFLFGFGQSSQSQDWPGLKRFHDDNIKLGEPAPGEKRVVFMGNSITDFWEKLSPEFFKNRPYIDRGYSGQTSPQMLLRFRADVIKLKPAVVLILAGTNDIAGNTGPSTLEMIEDNIISMAELAKANHIEPILCSVLPAAKFPWKPEVESIGKIIALNKMIKSYADKTGLIYV